MRAAFLAGAFVLVATPGAAESGYQALNAGITASFSDDDEMAIQQLTLALRAPDLPSQFLPIAHYDRALAYFDEDEYQKSISDCDAALGLRPDWYAPLLLRASSYSAEQQYDRALADASAAIVARPELPWGLTHRAAIHLHQHDYRAAIDDDTLAIALDPASTGPLTARALAYDFSQRYDLALSDELAAQALLGNPHGFDREVGVAEWLAGHNEQALASFQAAAVQDPDSRYTLLWQVIAQSASDAALADFAQSAARLDLNQWPGPIVSLFLGKASTNDVIASAANAPKGENDDRKCEADFYIAEWQLLHHVTPGVKEMLTEASGLCRYNMIELPAANRELQRLEQPHEHS